MRRLLLVAAIVAASAGSLAGTANAVCDPRFRPLCVNACLLEPPDLGNPIEILDRVCAT